MFCPKCGSILRPKKLGANCIMACSCGYALKDVKPVKLGEKLQHEQKNFDVVTNENDTGMSETEAECPKCQNRHAYFWSLQTRAGDEAETKFFRCTKCKHTWRDYD